MDEKTANWPNLPTYGRLSGGSEMSQLGHEYAEKLRKGRRRERAGTSERSRLGTIIG